MESIGTENTGNEIEIDVKGIMTAIFHRITIIIIVSVLGAGLAFTCSKYLVKPQYVSKTNVYIISKQDQTQNNLTVSDIAFATYLANDYKVLLTSEPVLTEVKKELNLEQTTSALAGMISVELIEDTRIMTISVTSNDASESKKIADCVRDVANAKTKDVMDGIEGVNAVDEANFPMAPSSPNIPKNTILGFLLGFLLSALVVAVRYILDDTIKTQEDIEKRLGIGVLASIPLRATKPIQKNKKKDKNKSKLKPSQSAKKVADRKE